MQHDIAVVWLPRTEEYKGYNVVYRKKLYHCQVVNMYYQDSYLKKFNILQKKLIVDNFNK